MKYREFSIKTTPMAEDIIAEAFLRYTDYGVSIIGGSDVTDLIDKRSDTFDYLDESVTEGEAGVSFVKGCFPVETAEEEFEIVLADIAEMKENSKGIIDFGSLTVTRRDFENDDWIKIWQNTLKPIEFERLCVVPSWLNYEGEKERVMIGSDLAFGTGAHETTAFCISFLEKYIKGGETVFDVGSGSGILGISAAKLSAGSIVMCDNDPQAVIACENNISLNNVSDKCRVVLSDLSKEINGQASVVVANITAEILLRLVENINDIIKEGGTLILSGILNDRVEKVIKAYVEEGFEFLEKSSSAEWSAVAFKKLRNA